MIVKKINGKLGLTLGIVAFSLITGAMTSTAFADSSDSNVDIGAVQTANATTQAAASYTDDTMSMNNKDHFVNINKSEVQNGIKVTVEKAIATKKDLKAILKVESDKPFDKVTHGNSIFELTYGNDDKGFNGTTSNETYVDDKTMIVTLERYNHDGEYSEKGTMRADVVLSKYKVNIGIEMPVDFTESFNNIIDKDICAKISGVNYTFNKLECDELGTRISYTAPRNDEKYTSRDDYKNGKSSWDSQIILKVGDKMYKTHSIGEYSEDYSVKTGNYESKSATYDVVKNEKNVSLIPVICNMTNGEIDEIYDQRHKNNQDNANKENINNVSYEKEFDFSDGTKGEIYNVERSDNTIKVYCKGESEKESLLMASNMNIHYQTSKENNDMLYYNNRNVSFYKDPKESLGYIVEFDNVQKDKAVDANIDTIIKQADKYDLEDEVQL